MKIQTSPEITVAAIAQQNGKFLMIEEQVRGALVINQPAGHLEHNETLIEAVQRECMEESGWQFQPKHLCAIYTWQHPRRKVTVVRFAFCGDAIAHDPHAQLDEGIVRALWLTAQEIRDRRERLRSPIVEHAMNDFLNGRRYPLDTITDVENLEETVAKWSYGR